MVVNLGPMIPHSFKVKDDGGGSFQKTSKCSAINVVHIDPI
jgi:hypothetical protein